MYFFRGLFFACLLLFSLQLYSKGEEAEICQIGNFALSTSQQPGPLIGFGENIVDRNDLQLFLFGDDFIGRRKYFIELIPSILYGVTDDFSILFSIPFDVRAKEDSAHSSGIEDIFLQLEYAIYTAMHSCSTDQVTLVANASFPTGSSHKDPPTGIGSMGYFIGTTYNHTDRNWFCFTSYGFQYPTSHHGTKFGNQFLYQGGVGANIPSPNGWIFAFMLEVDGTYSKRSKFDGKTDPDSGGNVIYLTPSFWASSKDWLFQLGLGYAVQQHLFGDQKRETFLLAFDIGKTF